MQTFTKPAVGVLVDSPSLENSIFQALLDKYHVRTYSSGLVGFESRIASDEPALLIIRLELIAGNGLHIETNLRKNGLGAKVLFASEDENQTGDRVDQWLRIPFSHAGLVKRVEDILTME